MAIVNSYASHYQRVYDDIASTRIRHQKAKDKLKKKNKNNPSELSSPSCAAGATELIFKICGVAQETWVRGNVFVGCQQKPKKRKGHVTNTLHQRVGVKRSWVPSSNQTWLAGISTI